MSNEKSTQPTNGFNELNTEMSEFRKFYNNSDWQSIYEMFSDDTKANFSFDDTEKLLGTVRIKTGKITTYHFQETRFDGEKGNAKWFTVEYRCINVKNKGKEFWEE